MINIDLITDADDLLLILQQIQYYFLKARK
ncbi:MAG: hypothetical protein JWP12_2515 [Bacteroidetes bacterium]|nr:hypothetical protein [Bacteroidota bacterium]